MNEVIKNTHAFVDVLCMARGDAVQKWDQATFERAFKWTRYFEEVYSKLKSKPALAEKLDRYLRNFNKTEAVYLGSLQLTFESLRRSGEILKQSLLQNPHISKQQFQEVLKLYGVTIGGSNDNGAATDLTRDLIQLNQLKGSLSVLSTMRDKLSADMKQRDYNKQSDGEVCCSNNQRTFYQNRFTCYGHEGVTTEDVGILTVSQLLFRSIHHHLTYSGKDAQSLHSKLNVLSHQENGLKAIVGCLVFIPDEVELYSQVDQVQQFVLKWILGFISCDVGSKKIWCLPPRTLSMVSFKYSSVFKLYLKHLISWGSNMIPVITCQSSAKEGQSSYGQVYRWRNGNDCDLAAKTDVNQNPLDNTGDKSFDGLVDHFKCLISGPPHIKEHCLISLQSQAQTAANETELEKQSTALALMLGVNIWMDVYRQLTEEQS